MSLQTWSRALGLLTIGLIIATPNSIWAVGDKAEKPAKKFETIDIKGALDNTDAPDPTRNTPCKIHSVDFVKGKVYQIDMISTEFDTFLRLEDAKGQQLAQDDDSGGGLNARIIFNATADGSYKIYATSFTPQAGGNYQLLIKEREPKVVKGAAIKLDENGAFQTQDQLTNQDEVGDMPPKSFQKVYKVEFKAGQTYSIDMRSAQLDSYLHVLDSNGQRLASDDDSGGNLDARIAFQPQVDGVYYVVATNLHPTQEGAYTLSIRKQ